MLDLNAERFSPRVHVLFRKIVKGKWKTFVLRIKPARVQVATRCTAWGQLDVNYERLRCPSGSILTEPPSAAVASPISLVIGNKLRRRVTVVPPGDDNVSFHHGSEKTSACYLDTHPSCMAACSCTRWVAKVRLSLSQQPLGQGRWPPGLGVRVGVPSSHRCILLHQNAIENWKNKKKS